MADDLLEHRANVLRPDIRRLRLCERLSPPLAELWSAAHRVLELGAVRLDAERRTTRRSDRAAHQDMVGEHEVGRHQLAKSSGVRVDVCVRSSTVKSWRNFGLRPS